MSEPDQPPEPAAPGEAVATPGRSAGKAGAGKGSGGKAGAGRTGAGKGGAGKAGAGKAGAGKDRAGAGQGASADITPADRATEDAAGESAAADGATTDAAIADGAATADGSAAEGAAGNGSAGDGDPDAGHEGGAGKPGPPGLPAPRQMRLTRVAVALLLMLLGFSLAVQVRSVSGDPTLAALGQEDLVRILANLDAHEERLREEIEELEESRRRLTTAGESQQEALAEAERRADELGILAGTLPAEGPGLVVSLRGGQEAVSGARLLDAVQELRGAGAEAMQIQGVDGPPVRVIASTYFGDADGGVVVDGVTMRAPYTLTVIGDPKTLAPALNLPGGVVESVQREGGTVTVQEEPGGVEVPAVRAPVILQHAQTVS